MKQLLAVLISCQMAFGAIAFDAFSASGYHLGAGTWTWAHTVTGSNPFLGVCVYTDSGGAGTVSAPLYNGVALTHGGSEYYSTATNSYINFYYSTSPATGTHNISITISGGGTNFVGIGGSYTGTGGFDAVGSGSNGTAALAFDPVTVVAANSWVGGCAADSGTVQTQGDGTDGSTVNVKRGTDALGGYMTLFDSNAGESAGAYSMKVFTEPDHVSTHTFGMLGFSIAPLSGTVRHRVVSQ